MCSNRSSSRLNLSSHAKVRSTRVLRAWMAALKNRLRPRLVRLRLRGILCDVGDHARIENARAIVRGIKARVKIEIRTCQHQACHFGDLCQCFETIRQQHHIRFMHWRDWERRQYIAMVVGHRDDLLPLLVLVARVATPIAPFFATVLVPSPCNTRRSSFFSSERWATLAMNACWSDSSSAHLAKAR